MLCSRLCTKILEEKLTKSAHPHKKDLLLCLPNLLSQEEDIDDDSSDWIRAIDRGGLTKVSNYIYQLFVTMEIELRKQLASTEVLVLSQDIKQAMLQNDSVQFFYSVDSGEWEEVGSVLLEMIVNEWVTIRGFSFTSAWIEKFKQEAKMTTEKSKRVEKAIDP